MSQFKTYLYISLKILLSIIMLSTIAGVAGSQLAPDVPLKTILLNCAIGAGVLFVIFISAVVVMLTFSQFILRKGGTDTSWFWFKSEPPGLERQRAELQDHKE
jgi:hypothetical protein